MAVQPVRSAAAAEVGAADSGVAASITRVVTSWEGKGRKIGQAAAAAPSRDVRTSTERLPAQVAVLVDLAVGEAVAIPSRPARRVMVVVVAAARPRPVSPVAAAVAQASAALEELEQTLAVASAAVGRAAPTTPGAAAVWGAAAAAARRADRAVAVAVASEEEAAEAAAGALSTLVVGGALAAVAVVAMVENPSTSEPLSSLAATVEETDTTLGVEEWGLGAQSSIIRARLRSSIARF